MKSDSVFLQETLLLLSKKVGLPKSITLLCLMRSFVYIISAASSVSILCRHKTEDGRQFHSCSGSDWSSFMCLLSPPCSKVPWWSNTSTSQVKDISGLLPWLPLFSTRNRRPHHHSLVSNDLLLGPGFNGISACLYALWVSISLHNAPFLLEILCFMWTCVCLYIYDIRKLNLADFSCTYKFHRNCAV